MNTAIGIDREHMAMSTIIASDEMHAEAEFKGGRLGDVYI